MEHILSLSYGKDSLACLEACKLLGYPIDRVIHAEVWATDTIPAELPPMVEFKAKADRIIKERYGLTVEHFAAERERERERLSFDKQFYTVYETGKNRGNIYGFPMRKGSWCNSMLKIRPLNSNLRANVLHDSSKEERPSIQRKADRVSDVEKTVVQQQAKSKRSDKSGFSNSSLAQGADTNIVQYLGIAADEPERIKRHTRPGIILPLVEIGWEESYCRKWCEENDLLSPTYTTSMRGGCWFCHNQSVDQLRLLRKNYPELWELLLKWDWDSPVSFHPDGRTVHDFDFRFYAEDLGLIPCDRKFRWSMLDNLDLFKEVEN